MKRSYFACLLLCLTTTFLFSQSNSVPLINSSAPIASPSAMSPVKAATDPKAQARILDSYGKLPLSFAAHHGQAAGQLKLSSRTAAYTLLLTGEQAGLALRTGNAAA